MRHATTLTYFLVALAAFGCSRDRDRDSDDRRDAERMAAPQPVPSAPVSVTGADWVLTRVGGDTARPAKMSGRPWFRLDPSDKRRVTGNTGVNLLSGTYELSGGALQFGPMITTKRAGDPDLMQQETRLLGVLERTATADLRGRTLVLRDAGRSALAEFEAMDVTR
ncbi:MAG: META domain-containing protein [Planctomycetota bacterium]|nr:META domain-containing protein [Planctomycetota bacterium]